MQIAIGNQQSSCFQIRVLEVPRAIKFHLTCLSVSVSYAALRIGAILYDGCKTSLHFPMHVSIAKPPDGYSSGTRQARVHLGTRPSTLATLHFNHSYIYADSRSIMLLVRITADYLLGPFDLCPVCLPDRQHNEGKADFGCAVSLGLT